VSKAEGRHQLVEAINEATTGVRNEIVRLLWWHSVVQQLAESIQCDAGYFSVV